MNSLRPVKTKESKKARSTNLSGILAGGVEYFCSRFWFVQSLISSPQISSKHKNTFENKPPFPKHKHELIQSIIRPQRKVLLRPNKRTLTHSLFCILKRQIPSDIKLSSRPPTSNPIGNLEKHIHKQEYHGMSKLVTDSGGNGINFQLFGRCEHIKMDT